MSRKGFQLELACQAFPSSSWGTLDSQIQKSVCGILPNSSQCVCQATCYFVTIVKKNSIRSIICTLYIYKGRGGAAPASGRMRHQIALPILCKGRSLNYECALVYNVYAVCFVALQILQLQDRRLKVDYKKSPHIHKLKNTCTNKRTYINESIPMVVTLHLEHQACF